LTLRDRILAFLIDHPPSTARIIARALDAPRVTVATALSRMFESRLVGRSMKSPFVYSRLDPLAAKALPSRALALSRSETKLADEQRILSVLAEDRAQDREILLGLLSWNPHRLAQALDRLYAAHLIDTVHGSYVLILRGP